MLRPQPLSSLTCETQHPCSNPSQAHWLRHWSNQWSCQHHSSTKVHQPNSKVPWNWLFVPNWPQSLYLQICGIVWEQEDRGSGQGERRGQKVVQISCPARETGSVRIDRPEQQGHHEHVSGKLGTWRGTENHNFIPSVTDRWAKHILPASHSFDHFTEVYEWLRWEEMGRKRTNRPRRIHLDL